MQAFEMGSIFEQNYIKKQEEIKVRNSNRIVLSHLNSHFMRQETRGQLF